MAKVKKHAEFQPEQQQNQQRVFGNRFEFKSDLFKLQVAECHMNKSWNDVPNLESVEHCHFYHTFDSDGRRMDKTNTVAGHFHVIEYEEQGDNKPVKIKSVSGPMRELKRRIKGRFTKVYEPVSEVLEDNHTHDVKYMRSEKIQARQISAHAVNIETQEAQKTAPIPGVQIG